MSAHERIQSLINRVKSARRRGTILLLVLGALAMVLILTVVYAALGKGDRATGRAVNDNRQAREVVEQMGERLVGIIGDDLDDLVPDMAEARVLELVTPPLDPVYRTETIDVPLTDFSKRSVLDEAIDPALAGITEEELSLLRFTPTGGHSTRTVWPATGVSVLGTEYPVDPRIAADPWLASTRPTDFGLGSKADSLFPGGYADAPFYARALDWNQISNVAPDGRFVNLFYLRDRFDAAALDLTRNPTNNEPRLTLFNAAGKLVDVDVTDGTFELGFANVTDYADIAIDGGVASDPNWNIPAHWTMYQRNMARTVSELSREGFESNDPNTPTFWEYSYADADGDGIIDSRWFELVDASSGFEVPLLGESNRRYFAAVRVIDLSSLANVNTATDSIAPPTLDNRAGQGPQDISLFTLLTLDMHGQAVTGVGADVDGAFGGDVNEVSYASFFTPLNSNDDLNEYDNFDPLEHVRYGRRSYLRLRDSIIEWQPTDYAVQLNGEDPSEVWSAELQNYSPYVFEALGPDRKRGDHALIGSAVAGFAGGGNARTGPFGVSDLVELLIFHGANDPETFSALEQAFTPGEPGANLSRSLLRSDRTLAAEIGVETPESPATGDQLTPEELNRRARAQLDIRSLLTTVSGARPIRSVTTDGAGLFALSADQRRFRADLLMLGSQTYEGTPGDPVEDIRQAQNDARNPLIQNGFELYLDVLAPYLSEFEGGTAWPEAAPTAGSPTLADNMRTLFYGHSGPEMALRMAAHMAVNFRDAADAPFIDNDDDGVADPAALLGVVETSGAAEIAIDDNGDGTSDFEVSYGERRDEPSRALLWLASQAERDAAPVDADDYLEDLIVGPAGSGTLEENIAVLDADTVLGTQTDAAGNPTSVLANEPAADIARSTDAMIVYGVEAQPFLSEVFYLNAFWDAPRGNPYNADPVFGGAVDNPDSDWIQDNEATGEYQLNSGIANFTEWSDAANRPDGVRGMVNIDGRVPSAGGAVTDNRDFLFQIVVFQVFNPFDVPVSLENVYIEWANAVYRPLDPSLPADQLQLQPNETRLLYATNPGNPVSQTETDLILEVSSRIDAILARADQLNFSFTAPPSVNGLVEEVIDAIVPPTLFGISGPRIALQRLDPFDGSVRNPLEDLLVGDQFLPPADPANGKFENGIVHLWWDLGDRFGAPGVDPVAARRDDILIDRLVDPALANPGDRATLDQRLRLGDRDFSATGDPFFPIESDGTVRQALQGDSVDAPVSALGGPENALLGVAGGLDNLNLGRQHSVALWSRIRRFETASDATGSGGRAANTLAMPSGVASNAAPSADRPEGAAGEGTNILGDLGIRGVPSGALPGAALATTASVVERAEDADAVLLPDGLDFTASFTGDPKSETTQTFVEFLPSLRDEFSPQRNTTITTGVFNDARYVSTTPFAAFAPLTNASGDEYRDGQLLQISRNSQEFRTSINGFPQLRIGDLLNVLAVGPYRMPLRNAPPAFVGDGYPNNPADPAERIQAYTDQWTTLGEALGVASDTLTGAELEDATSGFSDEFDQLAGVLDRGHLRLDEFVPYVDVEDEDGDGFLTDADGFDAAVDRVRGLGVPLALTIFDLAQAGGELPERAYGGIDQAVAGVININTAPPSILRLLPGVYQDMPIVGAPGPLVPGWEFRLRSEANGLQLRFANVLSPGTAQATVDSGSRPATYHRLDIASSILSYREPSAGYHRLLRSENPTNPLTGTDADIPLNMGPVATVDETGAFDLTRGVEMLREFSSTPAPTSGLFELTGPDITALRTTPGFGSIGELMAVRSSGDIGAGEDARRFQYGMDWPARDRRTVAQLFIDPTDGNPPNDTGVDFLDPVALRDFVANNELRIVSLDPSLLGDPLRFDADAGTQFQLPVADQIPDDYDEQLIQMNLLANAVSTSSDFYAAWMVVHGFEDDDVEGLENDEPMRPSFRGRYLMIVDRSNVGSRDDRPRVLAFLEVPYTEEVRRAVYTPE